MGWREYFHSPTRQIRLLDDAVLRFAFGPYAARRKRRSCSSLTACSAIEPKSTAIAAASAAPSGGCAASPRHTRSAGASAKKTRSVGVTWSDVSESSQYSGVPAPVVFTSSPYRQSSVSIPRVQPSHGNQ